MSRRVGESVARADASRKVARGRGGWRKKRHGAVGRRPRPWAGWIRPPARSWASTATVPVPRARGSSERASSIASRPSLGARPLRARPRDTPADARARDRRCRGEESLASSEPPPSVASPSPVERRIVGHHGDQGAAHHDAADRACETRPERRPSPRRAWCSPLPPSLFPARWLTSSPLPPNRRT